jgi:hypothetical protein
MHALQYINNGGALTNRVIPKKCNTTKMCYHISVASDEETLVLVTRYAVYHPHQLP